MSRPRPDRDLLHLNPLFRAFFAELVDVLAERGLPFKLHEGYRGRARQEDGRQRGTSRAGFLQSWHNYGAAADCVGSNPPVNRRTGRPDPWHMDLPWAEYGAAVRDVGLSWSGDWRGSFRELVHCDCSNFFEGRGGRRGLLLGSYVDQVETVEEVEWLSWWLNQPDVEPTMAYVACFQRLAVRYGGDVGTVDGIYGPATDSGVRTALETLHVDGVAELSSAELLSSGTLEVFLSTVRAEL